MAFYSRITAFLFFAGLVVTLGGVSFASAQGTNAQLVVATRTDGGISLPPSATVTVTGTGPSLGTEPGASGTLAYTTNWNNETRVVTLLPSNYSVLVSGLSGYLYSYSAGCSGSIFSGETKTCIVTASAASLPRVTVFTQVINNSGGTRLPTEFSFSVSGNNPSPAFFFGSASGVEVMLGTGSYSINDSTVFGGYDTTRSSGCAGTIAAGETRTCSITKDDRGIISPVTSALACHPPRQAARVGFPVAFTAMGGSGSYNWATADRTYLNVGPTLSAVLQTAGTQTVIVTSGAQTAVCVVDVLAAGVVYGTSTIPYLPNTGAEPTAAGALTGLAVVLLGAPLILYGRRTLAFVWR